MRTGIVAACIALAVPGLARADRRYYAWTYNAATAEPGGLDVELWTTLAQPRPGPGLQVWTHELELETGITESWDVALYNDFTYEQGGQLRYQAVKLESRYRPSQPGEWFVDPILYLEVKKELVEDRPWAVEGKVIVAKDVGPLNLSANLSAEQEFIPGGGTETEWGWYGAASWELHPVVRVGGETYGFWTKAGGGPYASTAYAGPALALAVSRVWLVLGTSWGMGDASDRFRARAVMAFQF
jgi:hypothetical protein